MTFPIFSRAVHARYNQMAEGELFVVDVEDIYATYLLAFPEGTDPIFRTRTVHDCNCCKQFIRRLGTLVSFDEQGNRLTVWDDYAALPEPYCTVARVLAGVVRQASIRTVFRSKETAYGTEYNYDTATGQRWDHFHGKVGRKHHSRTPATKRGEREAIKQVLKRGLEELRYEDIQTVLDLIEAKALYRGEEHAESVRGFARLQKDYAKASDHEAFIWSNLDHRYARFRNTVIGTLLQDLAEGKDLEAAVRMFESKVAPHNYKRPTALITPKMIEQAVAKLNELGLEGAVQRRMARIGDVNVNDVLFVDNAAQEKMQGGIAGLLMETIKPKPVNLKNAMEISIDEFLSMDKETVDLLVEGKHLGNFVTLTGGDGPERLFKWNNNFAWAYDGDVTDSIKQRVKAAGGKIDAKLRVSLAWFNTDDLDLHVVEPDGFRIHFGNKTSPRTKGCLDVDMNIGGDRRDAVENIYWNGALPDGDYKVLVNNYTKRESVDLGFAMELEWMGVIHQFSYAKAVGSKLYVEALAITIKNGAVTGVKPGVGIKGGGSLSVDKWGVKTETLVPVDAVMLSPNHWGEQAIGNKHWFFMLKGCKNPEAVRGIYNEFLRSDLDQHRKVFEILGAKTKCPSTPDQLSGVGFSSTRNDTVTVVINKGRAYNVKF